MAASRRSRASVAFRFAFLALAVGGLLWLLDAKGWDNIGRGLAGIGWSGLFWLLLLGAAEALVDAEAFRALLPVPVSRFYIYVSNQAGAFVNRFIPLETGEVLKGTLLSRRVPTADAVVGTVLWNYVFKIAKPIAAMVSLGAALAFGDPRLRGVAWAVAPLALLTFVPWAAMKVVILLGPGGILARVVKALRLPVGDPEALVARAREVDDTVRRFRTLRPAAWRAVLGWQILGRAFSWVSYWIALRTLDPAFDLATTGLVWTGFMLTGYAVSLLPSRLGTTEMSGLVLFEFLGLDQDTGLTTQLILSLRAIAVNGLSAACLVFLDTSKRVAEVPAPPAAADAPEAP